MDEVIKIKCPFDGAVLSVKNQPGIETKKVTCPICKHTYPFTEFRQVKPAADNSDPDTKYTTGDEETDVKETANLTLGIVKVTGSNTMFPLHPGRNVIGRKAQKSGADFMIDTGENRAMSREHIIIDVKKIPVKGYVHYISLYKEKVNKTFIGSEQLLYGDCIVLKDGDIIKLPDATLRFEIPDTEGTTF